MKLVAAITAGLSAGPVTHMVVDLAQVSFLDMVGLSALLRAHAGALRAGASLRIVRPQPLVQRVLHLTDTHLILTAGSSSAEVSPDLVEAAPRPPRIANAANRST